LSLCAYRRERAKDQADQECRPGVIIDSDLDAFVVAFSDVLRVK
jgi:hypothetical protein